MTLFIFLIGLQNILDSKKNLDNLPILDQFQLTRKMTNKYSITDSNNNSSKNPVSDNAESISSMR